MYFLLGFFPEAKIYFQIRQPRPDSPRSFFLLQTLPEKPEEEETKKPEEEDKKPESPVEDKKEEDSDEKKEESEKLSTLSIREISERLQKYYQILLYKSRKPSEGEKNAIKNYITKNSEVIASDEILSQLCNKILLLCESAKTGEENE